MGRHIKSSIVGGRPHSSPPCSPCRPPPRLIARRCRGGDRGQSAGATAGGQTDRVLRVGTGDQANEIISTTNEGPRLVFLDGKRPDRPMPSSPSTSSSTTPTPRRATSQSTPARACRLIGGKISKNATSPSPRRRARSESATASRSSASGPRATSIFVYGDSMTVTAGEADPDRDPAGPAGRTDAEAPGAADRRHQGSLSAMLGNLAGKHQGGQACWPGSTR